MVDERRVRRLVHGYADVDDDLVVAQLDRVGILDAFVAAVSRWADAGAGR